MNMKNGLKDDKKKLGLSKKYCLSVVGTAVLAATITAWYCTNSCDKTDSRKINQQISQTNNLEHKISFEEAKNNINKRDEYIKNLSKLILMPKYWESIEYSAGMAVKEKDGAYKDRNPSMLTTNIEGNMFDIGRKKLSSKTKIFPISFNDSKDEKAFLNRLMHESNMSKIIYQGFDEINIDDFYFIRKNGEKRFNNTLFQIAAELESYSKDISKMMEDGTSAQELNMAILHYVTYYRFLWAENNPTSTKVIERLKKTFFQEWMKNCSFYRTDEKGSYMIDENKIYKLPNDVGYNKSTSK